MMFPYPSAEGLHVGSFFTYGGIDAYGRFKRMQGYEVFEPIGLDGFGIHSENYALKVGRTPQEHARISEENFYRQLRMLGNGFDWTRKLETYDPAYYKWTQWLFTKLFKAGLAYKAKAAVNFCPSCKTVLSDEQVVDGKCERCSSVVGKRELKQWFFKVTNYAQRLLQNTEKLDWTKKVKIAQKNWIGKSEGALIQFCVSKHVLASEGNYRTVPGEAKGSTGRYLPKQSQHERKEIATSNPSDASPPNDDIKINVFTTRIDTLFGATFLVLSPEHQIVAEISNGTIKVPDENKKEIATYLKKIASINKEDIAKEKTGVFTGLYAINPINNKQIPVWIADYVLMEYGTGAIMAVPAHDERDYEFAQKYSLPVVQVVSKKNAPIKSYLMGAEKITDKDLTELGITIHEVTEKGYRKIMIPEESLSQYEKLIEEKLTPGYWNEYIGKDIVFLFKHKTKPFERILLSPETEEKIERTGAAMNDEEYTGNMVWKWLSENDWYHDLIIHSEYGTLNNFSEKLKGLTSEEAKKRIVEKLGTQVAHTQVKYHLRDWLISRQRYWGAPIPMIYCESCAKEEKSWFTSDEAKNNLELRIMNDKSNEKIHKSEFMTHNSKRAAGWFPVPDDQLPVRLPEVADWKPMGTGKSPLANHPDFYQTTCPNCGGKAVLETDVCDTFLDSSWYFFRYTSTEFEDRPFDTKRVKKWLPVTSYIGGAEHAVLHLLYSRFIAMVLHDLGYIEFEEPYARFRANGLIIKDGTKMSKSKGNVINPDEYVKKFGADTLRTYLGFVGPFTQGGDFQDSGIEGIHRFLKRVWKFVQDSIERGPVSSHDVNSSELSTMLHKTIKGVTQDMEDLRFNTAIAKIMTLYNFLSDQKEVSREAIEVLLKLLAPFAPYMTEELWQNLKLRFMNDESNKKNHNSEFITHNSIHLQPWPTFNPKLLIEDEVTIAVLVNGKLRDTVCLHGSASSVKQSEVEKLAKESLKIHQYLQNQKVRKIIYVPGKILNFVV